MDQPNVVTKPREPWNKGKLVGQKAPFKLKEIWAIRIRLQLANSSCEGFRAPRHRRAGESQDQAAEGPCARWPSVADGEAELGIAATTVFLPVPGVELVGPFPPGFQHFFVLTAGVGAAAKQPDAAKALIKHIAAPSAAAVLKAKGLEPVTR